MGGLLTAGVIAIIVLVLVVLFMGYVKAPPDTAFIISGRRKEPKIIVGRSSLRIPYFGLQSFEWSG